MERGILAASAQDTTCMAFDHLVLIRTKLKETGPDGADVRRILGKKEARIREQLKTGRVQHREIRHHAIEEIIRLLFHDHVKEGKDLANALRATTEDFLNMAEVAFDIAAMKNDTVRMFCLNSRFLFDARRSAQAVAHYLYALLGEGRSEEARQTKAQHKRTLSSHQLQEWGVRFFKQAMTFAPSEDQRDYTLAVEVQKLFNLETTLTTSLARAQYDYCMHHDLYEQAADLADFFALGTQPRMRAALEVFKRRFAAFEEKLMAEKYRDRAKLPDTDPYMTTLTYAQQAELLDNRYLEDPACAQYPREVRSVVFSLLRKLMKNDTKSTASLYLKSFFCGIMVRDYTLLGPGSRTIQEECAELITSLVEQYDPLIHKVSEANKYYDVLVLLYQLGTQERNTIRRFGQRIFELYADHHLHHPMAQCIVDFELSHGDTYPALKNKCLELLDKNDLPAFFKFCDAVSMETRIGKDEDFIRKVFYVYQSLIFTHDYETALTLSKRFTIPAQRRLEPVRSLIGEMLRRGEYKRARGVMQLFGLQNRHIRQTLLTTYLARTKEKGDTAARFRQEFDIKISDIGVLRWFFTEILHFPRFQ